MLKKILLLCLCFSYILYSGCFHAQTLWIGIAEDQSSSLAKISKELDQGRKLTMQLLSHKDANNQVFRLKSIDTINNPEKTANAFRILIDQHQVKVLLGVPSTECAQIAKHIAEARSIPFICNAYDATISEDMNQVTVFRQNPIQLGQLTALYFFYVMKKNRLSVLYDEALQATFQSAKGFLEEGRLIGATMIEETFSSYDRPADWQVKWSRLHSAQPEVILIAADPSHYRDLLTIAKQVLMVPAIFVLHHQPQKEDLLEHPTLFENIYILTPFYEQKPLFSKSSFFQQYIQRFNEAPSYYSAQGHDEIMLLYEIQKKRNHLALNERFSSMEGFIPERDLYFTGFRGFMTNSLSMNDIDVLKVQDNAIEYLGAFWMEILSKGGQ